MPDSGQPTVWRTHSRLRPAWWAMVTWGICMRAGLVTTRASRSLALLMAVWSLAAAARCRFFSAS
ncbi:hypothetical protein AQF52_0093 [Streptomyces venezuelae]|nr:hypothetical protein AQF52_0093 [Streptomyces venezuelae]